MVIFALFKTYQAEMDQIKDHPLYRKHDMDSAISALWDFYKKRFVALFLISLVMSAITQYSTMFIDLKSVRSYTDPLLALEELKRFIVPLLILGFVGLIFNVILHFYILHKPLNSSANIFACIFKSLKYIIPYFILMIIYLFFAGFAIALGVAALFVGVLFAIPYVVMISFFILPVMMAEEATIGNTIKRIFRLSHSSFWPNMGWTVVFIILIIIISMVLSGIVLLPFAGSFIKTFANPQDTSSIVNLPTDPIFLLLSSAVKALTLPLYPIFGFIIYFNGKAREDNLAVTIEPAGNEQKVRVEDLYAKPREENNFDQKL